MPDDDKQNEQNKTNGITVGMKPKLPALHKRISKKDFVQCIEQNFGLTTAICNKLDCSYTQYWYAVKKWGLDEFVKEQRKNLVSVAETTMSELLNSKDENIRFKAAQYTLKSLARDTWGDNPQTAIQINGADKIDISQIFGIQKESFRQEE